MIESLCSEIIRLRSEWTSIGRFRFIVRFRIKDRTLNYLIALFEKDDSPLKLAAGFALGCCVNFFPTFGFGLPLAVILAFVTRTSIIASLIGENFLKILLPFLWYLNLVVGSLFFPLPESFRDIKAVLALIKDWQSLMPFIGAFMTGALINTLIFGLALAFATYILLKKERQRVLSWLKKRKEENV